MDRETLRKNIEKEYITLQKRYEEDPNDLDNFNKREELWHRADFLKFEIVRVWGKDYKMTECYVKDVN